MYKNKLEYKDLNKDEKIKKNMTQKLKEIKEVDEVNLIVEVPKIFGGKKSEIETAIYLKNIKERDTQLSKDEEENLKQQD